MREQRLPLRTGTGWREVPPRSTAFRIAWESRQNVFVAETDFSSVQSIGAIGPVDSSLVYDPDGNRLYRYASSPLSTRRGFNEISSWCTKTFERSTFLSLHPLRWIPWFLSKSKTRPLLIGLVVTDATLPEKPGIQLLHQIGVFHIREQRSLYRPLPDGCQFPLAWDDSKQRILFHGQDGYQLVDLKGNRILLLHGNERMDGRGGASFHPKNPSFVIGGTELFQYQPLKQQRQTLHQFGIQPAWDPAGEILYFLEHSGHLCCYFAASTRIESIVSIINTTHPETKCARTPVFSPDGKYAALPLTRRSPLDTKHLEPGQPSWSEHQILVILDFEKKHLWQHPGKVSECCWLNL